MVSFYSMENWKLECFSKPWSWVVATLCIPTNVFFWTEHQYWMIASRNH
jgi:hypothetical protein